MASHRSSHLSQLVTASPTASAVFDPVDTPHVSIVIVTYGTGRIVLDALDALAASLRHEPDIDAEVIVVDNLHPDSGHLAAARIALATSGVRLVEPESNLGFGGGNDVGIHVARADTICLFNPDLIASDGWLSALLAMSRRHPDHIVAPRLVGPDGALDEAGQRVGPDGKTHPRRHDAERVDYASAACWVLRRSLYDDLGGFDAAYHPAYYEDVDFAFRVARVGGGTMVHPDVTLVHHRGSGSTHGRASLDRQLDVFRTRWSDEIARRNASFA